MRPSGKLGPGDADDEVTVNIRVITFSLSVPDKPDYGYEISVELEARLGCQAVPLCEGDQVWVEGIWKPRTSTLTANRDR